MKTTGNNEMKINTTGINETVDVVADTTEQSESIFGVVVNCKLLNVRETPNKDAEILTKVKQGNEIMVDFSASTDDFYSVCTQTGVEGYCMKQFIEVR